VEHEIVAVDDGSTDGSLEELQEAGRLDPRLRVMRSPGRGLVCALNAGLEGVRSPLVARMDADDVAHRERLAMQARWLAANTRPGVLACRVRLLGGERNQGMRAYVRWQNALLDHETIVRDLFVESPLAHPSVMMRTDLLRRLGGYRSFDGPEDYDLWLRAHEAGVRFSKLPEVLLGWRDRQGRLSRTDPRYAEERFRALKIEVLLRTHLARSRPVVIWGAGPVGKGWARDLRARGVEILAFAEVDRRKIGQKIAGAPVLHFSAAASSRRPLHLVAVGQPGGRERIRAVAAELGLEDGRDLVAVA
jgi:glycosyltransferase involved in cell wall biosynthesis